MLRSYHNNLLTGRLKKFSCKKVIAVGGPELLGGFFAGGASDGALLFLRDRSFPIQFCKHNKHGLININTQASTYSV